MANLDFRKFQHYLSRFEFASLFVEVLGWNRATADSAWQSDEAGGAGFEYRMLAELAGVAVLQVVADEQWPDENQRLHIWRKLSHRYYENLLIFTDRTDRPAQSLWYWVKRSKDPETGKQKLTPRRHEYFRGQPVDLFASKLHTMVVELSELDENGRIPVLEVARRVEAALDIEKTTKRFYREYQEQHAHLLDLIEGIDSDRDRRWYASVILNRLMFVWFMQKKGFIDHDNRDYLPRKLRESQARGKNRFFGEFLNALFFEAFAKPVDDRSPDARELTGEVPYLNGGLFLHHRLELDDNQQPRLGTGLRIPDAAFEGVFEVFGKFTWHLDDTPGGNTEEINPDVLGYIFEKYINQKAFGAYYTRPEITSYLADRSIHALILERIRAPAFPELGIPAIDFESVPDLLAKMDARTALKLVNEVLPSITVLDPAVGSGAFLVAALKALINVYSAVVGRAELGASDELGRWLQAIHKDHPSVGYYIKRRIVTDNLHGVDIMEEACEIAKLRLFLAMVASVRDPADLEPLPNIDFNILPGNSLIGLMRVDEHEFNQKSTTGDLFKRDYRTLVNDKNRKLDVYRHTARDLGKELDLRGLRDDIDAQIHHDAGVLNELLRDQFDALGVRYSQATWDAAKGELGKPKKRKIQRADVDALRPFHWGYLFDDVMQRRGGFDIILTNPPWEVLQADEKEFFARYDPTIRKKKVRIEEWYPRFKKLISRPDVRREWIDFVSSIPHQKLWFKRSADYRFQTSGKINLYMLFLERCFHLLRAGGQCGIVIPSGIYTDLGATGLRDMLFEQARIQGLFGFENRKEIFEDVHRSYKFVVLTFEKSAAPRLQAHGERNASAPPDDLLAPGRTGALGTQTLPAAFMRLDVAELDRFPEQGALWLSVDLIRKLSPDEHSLMEFKSELDVAIVEKMLRFPTQGEKLDGVWNLRLTQEFNMTTDAKKGLFKTAPAPGCWPLYEGKMIWQFDAFYAEPHYWVDEKAGRADLIGRNEDRGQRLDYQTYRLGFRDIARNTDTRTLISCLIPPTFHGNKVPTVRVFDEHGERLIDSMTQLALCAIWNSFTLDWMIRQKVTTTINFFYLYQLPVPRLAGDDEKFAPLARRAAQLICTRPEFDALAKEAGLRNHRDGVTDPAERARLRAELDGLVAHLYSLTDAEFQHILGTFPLVPDAVKVDAYNAYRKVAQGLVQ